MSAQSLCLMYLFLTSLLSVAVVASSDGIQLKNRTCPFWHIPEEKDGNTTCKCGDTLDNMVICSSDAVIKVAQCFCMSYVNGTDVIGNCLYTCAHNNLYVNSISCPKWLHRTGQMCGECEDGFSPPVYSYFFGCINCSNYEDYKYNWLKYIVIAYVPLTVFYFVVVLCRIRTTSAQMNALVFIIQISSFSTLLKMSDHQNSQILGNVGASLEIVFSGIFNLDFFRSVYKPFCLSPHLSTIQITALDYLIGIYPLFLILVTYVLVKLHDNFSLVVRIWKPFNRCFARLDTQWNMTGSLVDTFATFLLLSYVKTLNVSLDLLTPVSLFDVNGTPLSTSYVYIDGTVEYFGKEHLPYGILAIVAFLLFTVLPVVLLCLYPCPCFQKCLNHSGVRWQALHIFMDSFQGCYREKPRYCKCFAAVYLLARIGSIACFGLVLSREIYWIVELFFLIFPAMLVAVIRPYRDNKYNIIDVILLLSMIGVTTKKQHVHLLKATNLYKFHIFQVLYFISGCIPVVYGSIILVHKLLPKCVIQKVKALMNKFSCKKDNFPDPWPARLDVINEEQLPLLNAAQ